MKQEQIRVYMKVPEPHPVKPRSPCKRTGSNNCLCIPCRYMGKTPLLKERACRVNRLFEVEMLSDIQTERRERCESHMTLKVIGQAEILAGICHKNFIYIMGNDQVIPL